MMENEGSLGLGSKRSKNSFFKKSILNQNTFSFVQTLECGKRSLKITVDTPSLDDYVGLLGAGSIIGLCCLYSNVEMFKLITYTDVDTFWEQPS